MFLLVTLVKNGVNNLPKSPAINDIDEIIFELQFLLEFELNCTEFNEKFKKLTDLQHEGLSILTRKYTQFLSPSTNASNVNNNVHKNFLEKSAEIGKSLAMQTD